MKSVLLLLFLLIGSATWAQDAATAEPLFMVTYTTGSAWDHAKSPNDQAHFAAHSKHLSDLRKSGVIKLGARAGEEGIIIFSARDLEAANSIINSDTAVSSHLFKTEIQPFNVFYPGCVER